MDDEHDDRSGDHHGLDLCGACVELGMVEYAFAEVVGCYAGSGEPRGESAD